MELVDMAVGNEGLGASPAPYVPNPYPYSLRLNLTHEQLEKLGYSELPPAGTHIKLEATACVVRVESCDPDADGDIDYSCIELQIKELGIEQDGVEDDEEEPSERSERQAGNLYGGKKDKAAA